jgi:hypothetical protein
MSVFISEPTKLLSPDAVSELRFGNEFAGPSFRLTFTVGTERLPMVGNPSKEQGSSLYLPLLDQSFWLSDV